MQNILLVEDNKADALLAKIEIERMGFSLERLDIAANLAQARTLISAKDYSAVFLDYVLTDGNGTELLTEIDQKKTTVIMLSGQIDIDSIKKQYGGDVSGVKFTQKPLREKDLEDTVNRLKMENEYRKMMRARCVAFWSVVSVVAGAIGSFVAENSEAAKAAFKTFMDIWLHK